MNPTIKALFLFAEHCKHHTDQCLILVHHIECGDKDLFTRKAKIFIRKHINENPHMPEDVREQILSLLETDE